MTQKPPEGVPIESIQHQGTDGIERAVVSIGTGNDALKHRITQAQDAKEISPEEAVKLQRERQGLLGSAFLSLAKAVPTSFKPRLYDALEKRELDLLYIESLDPVRNRQELEDLESIYYMRLGSAFQEQNLDKGSKRAHHSAHGLITILQKLGINDETRYTLSSSLYSLSPKEDTPAQERAQRESVASTLMTFGMQNASPETKILLLNNFVICFEQNPRKFIAMLPREERPQAVSSIASELRYRGGVFRRNEYIFSLLDELEQQQQADHVLPALLQDVARVPEEDNTSRVALAKRLLDYATESQRTQLIRSSDINWRNIITGNTGQSQLDQIVECTGNTEEQDALFWAVAHQEYDYPAHERFDMNAAVGRTLPDWRKTQFVLTQRERGTISNAAVATYGTKIIDELLTSSIQPEDFLRTAQRFGVSLEPYRRRLLAEVEEGFRARTLTPEQTLLAQALGNIELTTEWEPFHIDMLAKQEYGERTWRTEQSMIDMLQNHLDANDFRYAYRLVEAALGKETSDHLLQNGKFATVANRIWRFRQRYPFPEGETNTWKYHVYEFNGTSEELAQKISTVERQKPGIEFLLQDEDGSEVWTDYSLIETFPQTAQITGVCFSDNGMGYDEQLNAKFIPTKSDVPFLRGTFGQGAKMSMIALLREGCQVSSRSAYFDPETGERMEWEGHPELSKETNTVVFTGKRTRSFNTDILNGTGSVTEIRFDKAKPTARNTFQMMFDTRLDPEGIGKYVIDYQSPNTYQYGGFDSETQISISPLQRKRVYVQGLNVPAQNSTRLGCGYNLPSSDFLTGRDRTYLETDAFVKEITQAWAGVSDQDTLNHFYTLVLGRSDNSHPVEKEVLRDLTWQLSNDAKDAHKIVIPQVLGLDDTHQRAVLVGKIDETNREAIEKLQSAGFSISEGIHDPELEWFVNRVLDKQTLFRFEHALGIVEGQTTNELVVSERLHTQIKESLSQARSEVKEMLNKAGLSEESKRLQNTIFDIQTQKQTRNGNGAWLQRVKRYDSSAKKFEGHTFIVFPENIVGSSTLPEQFSEDDTLYLKFLIEMQLLSTSVTGESSINTPQTQFQYGQHCANNLLVEGVSDDTPAYRKARDISIRPHEVAFPQQDVSQTIAQDQRAVTFRNAIREIRETNAALESVSVNLETINSMLSEPTNQSVRMLARMIVGKQYFDNGSFFEIDATRDTEQNVTSLHVREVPSTLIGKKGTYDVHVVGRGEQARIVIPLNLENTNAVVIKDDKTEKVASKYERPLSIGNWGRDTFPKNPYGIFSDDFMGGYLASAQFGRNFIAFPIGSFSEHVVSERSQYFLNTYPLEIELPGTIKTEEENIGKSYVEASHSVEYGRGKVWDDPRRIFGDVLQNHIDEAGKDVTIQYEVSMIGKREWVDREMLLNPSYESARIVGVSFADTGSGYTTKQLLVFGESGKRRGGKRGKFGEGLNMLSSSCVRNGFNLTLRSKTWEAAVSSRPHTITTHGTKSTTEMVGYEMRWLDQERKGSETVISIPDELKEESTKAWQKWADVLDPRIQNELGYRGLERYVRALRSNERTVQIGPVTILLDENNTFYEGGLLIPDAEKRMDRKSLFGYDFDGDIIATQERNVVDEGKLHSFLVDAFQDAPPQVWEKVLDEVRYQSAHDEQNFALFPMLRDVLTTDDQTALKDPKTHYREFDLIQKVDNIEALRFAYFNTFGEDALLSSGVAAQASLEQGIDDKGEILTEEEQALLRSVVVNEQYHYDPRQLVILDSIRHYALLKKLEGAVPTTRAKIETLMQQPRDISEAQLQQVHASVRETSREMADTFHSLYNSPRGREVLKRLMRSFDRKSRPVPEMFEKSHSVLKELKIAEGMDVIEDEEVEQFLFYLEAVAEGVIPLNIQIKNSALSVEAYVFGLNGIAFADRTFEDPKKTAAITKHELLHLASQTEDYNTTFLGLLLLANPHFAQRYI